MSERPTPETDGAERMAFAQEYMVPTDFARKLERERDRARELAQAFHNDQVTLLLERDEARELCRELADLVADSRNSKGKIV